MNKGITAMQDAILFLVLVSFSGMILLPAFTYSTIKENEIKIEKNELADETLIVLLFSDGNLKYTLAEGIAREMLKRAPVNVMESRYGEDILGSILYVREYHKNYGELIVEDLASQIMLFPSDKHFRINILTTGFDRALKENISAMLNRLIGKKYYYNFTAYWLPIKGIPFGGYISVGRPPPMEAYVSSATLTMPFSTKIKIGEIEVCLNKKWIDNKINRADAFRNIENIINNPDPDKTKIKENLSELIMEVLFHGIKSGNKIILPGLVNISIYSILEAVFNLNINSLIDSLNNVFGMNGEMNSYIKDFLLSRISKIAGNTSIKNLIEYISSQPFIKNFIDSFINYAMGLIDNHTKFENAIEEWIVNRIDLSRAEISLSIWDRNGV